MRPDLYLGFLATLALSAQGALADPVMDGTLLAGSIGQAPQVQMAALLPKSRKGPVFGLGSQEVRLPIYLTGYSYWSNTPAGSTAIARPVVHSGAGGSGTYNDPLTIAVGYTIRGFSESLDFPAGTRFYLVHLHKYAIVEDECGDGPSPQTTGCHIGHRGLPWLDLYVGGQRAGESVSYTCAVRITGVQLAIMSPRSDYPVTVGPLSESGCPTFDERLTG